MAGAAGADDGRRLAYSAPMTRSWLVLGLLCVACPAGPGGAAKSDGKVDAKTDAKVDAKVDAKADAKTDTKGVGEAPPPAVTGDDWLVWWFKGDAWTTRWLRVEGDQATVVGEKKALVVGDGARLWQVERADKRVKLVNCECEREPGSEFCDAGSFMPSMGLRARPLGGLEAVAIKEAATGTEYADDVEYGLSIVGGAQARLVVQSSTSGYLCGAHGLVESWQQVFDVGQGKRVDEPFKDWWKQLPEEVRREGAKEIHGPLTECDVNDEAPTVDEVMNGVMALSDVFVRLAGGEPTIEWMFSADLPYVCSPDYGAHGGGTTGLIPQAAPLGLAGPLPEPVLKDIKPIGDAQAFGFSKLTLGAAERQAATAEFAGIAEAPWPKETVSNADEAAPAPGLAKLAEGRTLSRAGDLAKAIAAFDEAIKLDAGLAAAWSERGYARLRAGEFAAAKKDCEKALGLEAKPSFQAAAWFNLGLIAEGQKKPDEARAAYLKSQALRDTKQVKAALAALDAAKK